MRLALLLLLTTSTAYADDEIEHEEPHHENHAAIFIGATTADSTTHFTLGADYERRLPMAHAIGVGVLVDSAIGSTTETLLAGFVAVHPIGGLMVLGAAGVAMTGLGHDGHLGLRVGVAYHVEVGGCAVGPALSLDRVDGENAYVYGVSVGKGF